MTKCISLQIQQAQLTKAKRYMKKTVSKHIVIKLLKTSAKDKILKEAKGKKKTTYIITYRGRKIM